MKYYAVESIAKALRISRFYTDGWDAYERHLEAQKHEVGKQNMQKNRKQT